MPNLEPELPYDGKIYSVYNPIFKKHIEVSEKIYEEYLKKNEALLAINPAAAKNLNPHFYYPFQNYAMIYQKDAVLIKGSDVNTFLQSYVKMREVYHGAKNCNILLQKPRVLDILRMQRSDDTTNYKYIIDSDPNIRACVSANENFIRYICGKKTIPVKIPFVETEGAIRFTYDIDFNFDNNDEHIGSQLKKNFNQTKNMDKIFVPFIENNRTINLTYDPENDIYINNDSAFIAKLGALVSNGTITKNDAGRIIEHISAYFVSFRKHSQGKLSDVEKAAHNVDTSSELTKGLFYDRIISYGLDYKDLAILFWKRQEAINELYRRDAQIHKLFKEGILSDCRINKTDCNDFAKEYYDMLGSADTFIIANNTCKLYKEMCWFNKYKHLFQKQSVAKPIVNIDDATKLANAKYYIDKFRDKNLHFSENDIYDDKKRYGKVCVGLYSENDATIKKIHSMYGIQIDYDGVTAKMNLQENYMPEWYEHIMTGDKEGAFKNRQFILGQHELTNGLDECPLIRSDPFIYPTSRLEHIIWSTDVNKLVVSTHMFRDLIFPFRIVLGNPAIVQKYISGNLPKEKILIGTILTRNDQNNFEQSFIYHDPINKTRTFINQKGNIVYRYSTDDAIKVLYVELNLLYYSDNNLQIKYNYYNIRGTNDFLVSQYTLDEIRAAYTRFKYADHKSLDSLSQVYLTKDANKNFFFR